MASWILPAILVAVIIVAWVIAEIIIAVRSTRQLNEQMARNREEIDRLIRSL